MVAGRWGASLLGFCVQHLREEATVDRFTAVILIFLLLAGACTGGDPSASHAADTSSATDTAQTPAQAAHALVAGDVARAIGLLQGAGCLDAGAATALTTVLEPGTQASLAAFAEALDGADVCAGGASFLRAASKAPLLLAFEADGIVFDGDGDGCYDSTLLLPGATVVSHDADGDGCRDQLDHLPALVARLGLHDAVAQGLLVRAADVAVRMVPLPYWHEPWASPPGPGFDWPTFRAEAEPRLDELVAWASTEVSAGARETVLAFLENARPTVASFPTFAPPPFTSDGAVLDRGDTKADDPVGAVDQKWLCLYVYSDRLEAGDAGPVETFSGHAFVGLSQGDDEWRRGLYLYGHGANSGPLPKVPEGGTVTGDGSAEKASWENTVQRSSQPSFLWLESARVVGPGDVRNDGGAAWHYRICWKITGAEWDAVAAAMSSAVVNPPLFQLFQGPAADGQSCVVWAGGIVALAGKRVPDGSKLGNGSPFALANSIHKLVSSGKLGGADRVERFQGCGDGVVQTALGESCETPTKKCSVFAHAKGSTSATEYTGVCNLSCQCEVVDAELGAGTFVAQGCFYDWDCPKATHLCWERHCQKPLPGADPNVGSCASRPSTGPCDDGDPCTVGDSCDVGVCKPGPVKSCEDDGKPCTSDACDSATGACNEPLPDGTPCDDGLSCTDGDSCKAGVCQGVVGFCCATNLDCPGSGDPCSSVECIGGICQAFETGCCTSAADCTGGTICQTADCVGARCVYSNVSGCCLADSDCSTGDPCTAGVCDKTTNACKVSAVPDCCNVDADCADDDVCTVNTCVDHACQHTVPPDCALACCVDMQCESLTLNQCTVAGGTIIGKSCLDAYCEVVPCCSSAGSCSLAAPHDCSPPSGWPMYLAGTCSPDLCPKAQGCCLPDGSCSNLAAPACGAAKGVVHGGECGVFLPEPCPQPDDPVCCAQGGAKAGKLAQRALAECVGEGGHPADAAQCEDACCHQGGTWAFTLAGECPGVIVELGACMVDCCKTDVDARFRKVAECAATGGVAAPWSECALVCCQLPSGVLADLSAFECAINGGKAIPEQACGPVCCEDSATATALLTPWPNCEGVPGKKIVASDRCDTVCCESPAGPLTTTRGSCELDGGVVLTEETCVEVCCRYGFGGPSWSVTDASVCSALGGTVRPGAECALACCLVQPNPAQHQVLRHGLCDEKGYPVVGGASAPACEGLPVTCGLDADCWGLSNVLDAIPTEAGCTQSHCEPALGICVVTPAAEGTACEDGDSCTLGDACDDTGICVPGPVASCVDDTDPCTTPSCVPLVGQCALAAGDCCQTDADCADGNTCTADACTFTLSPDNATFVKQCHNDAIEGCCIFDVECDDGDSCTEDGCVDNACVNVRAEGCCMEEAECDDGIVCTYDTCDWSGAGPAGTPGAHGTCKNQLWEDCCTADTDCDDGNPCTANVCDPLLIVPVLGKCMYPWSRETCCKTASDCDDGKPCTWDACVPDLASKLWSCENLPIEDCTPCAEDADCDDGDACNGAETCVLGKCTPGQAPYCGVDAPCLSGACDPATGCVVEPAEGECDDGDGCTTADYCADGDCLPGQVVECDDAGPCMTAAGCDPGDGSCLPPAPVEDGSQCDGGVCQGGACKPAAPPCGQLGAVVDCGAQAVAVSIPVEGGVAALGFSTQGAAASGQATVYLSLPNKDPVYAAEVLTIGAASCGPMVPVQKTQGSGWITLKFPYGPNQTYAVKLYRDFSAGTGPLVLTIDATCL